ncbi:MAG: signal transduction histidine kinase [Saprospiraceae bacterium]
MDITITAILNEENICTKLLLVIRDNTLKHRAKENMIFKILETEDRERSRFAKELHDSLGQNLTAASLTFNQVKKSTDELSPDTRKSFETGIKFLKEAIDESRNIAHNLMPQAIKDFGYVLAVEGLLEDLSQTTGIEFTFYNNLNDERLSSDHELSLFRITQEAIQNILKHAEATKVTIQLIKHIDSIILSIEDNGKGFDSKTLKTKSFGLNSMKARSSALSGVIDIDGFPGKGVLITLEIPITALSQ